VAALDGAIEDDDTGIIAKDRHIVRAINRHPAAIVIVLQFVKVDVYFNMYVRDCAFLIAKPLIDSSYYLLAMQDGSNLLETPRRDSFSFSTDNGIRPGYHSVLK
jgi:hypothetical protein